MQLLTWTFVQSLFADGCAKLVTEDMVTNRLWQWNLLFSIAPAGLPYKDAVEAGNGSIGHGTFAAHHSSVQNVYGVVSSRSLLTQLYMAVH